MSDSNNKSRKHKIKSNHRKTRKMMTGGDLTGDQKKNVKEVVENYLKSITSTSISASPEQHLQNIWRRIQKKEKEKEKS